MDKAAVVLGALGATGICPCGREIGGIGASAEYIDEDGRQRCEHCWDFLVQLAVEYLRKAATVGAPPATDALRAEWWDAAASR